MSTSKSSGSVDYSPGSTGEGGAISSFGGTSNVTNTTADESNNAASAQYAFGNVLSVSEGASLEYNGSDFGAISAGKDAFNQATQLAESAIQEQAASTSDITETSLEAERAALDLAKTASQGQGGTLINGLKWLAGIAALGLVGWAVATNWPKERAA